MKNKTIPLDKIIGKQYASYANAQRAINSFKKKHGALEGINFSVSELDFGVHEVLGFTKGKAIYS